LKDKERLLYRFHSDIVVLRLIKSVAFGKMDHFSARILRVTADVFAWQFRP
jgi:hypothetical protein